MSSPIAVSTKTSNSLNPLVDRLQNSPWISRVLMMVIGGLYPLAFAPFEFWPAAFISLIPLFYCVFTRSPLSPFQAGYFWGVGALGVGVSWVYVSIHEFGFVPVIGAALMTALFVLFLALFKALFAWLTDYLSTRSQPAMFLLIAPLIWLMFELVQSFILGGFPWLLAGYSQIDAFLAPLATWTGVYGVSWLIALLSALVSLWIFNFAGSEGKSNPAIERNRTIESEPIKNNPTKNNQANINQANDNKVNKNRATVSSSKASRSPYIALKNQSLLSIAIVILLLIITTHLTLPSLQPSSQKPLDIALVQPNTPQAKKWDRRYFGEIVQELFETSAPLWTADLVIWPEGAIPAYAHQVNDILADIDNLTQQFNSHFIVGIPQFEAETRQSYVTLMSRGSHPQLYQKQVLVPFGEYVPLQDLLRGLIRFLDLPMSGFSAGNAAQPPMLFDGFSVVPAICYEIVYPTIIHRLATDERLKGEPLIVTVSNDAWFGDSFGPYQHMQMARMRSLELGIPLVRSTNDGITAFVDGAGQVISELPRYQRSYLRHTLSLDSRTTVYRQFGFAGVWAISILSILAVLWSIGAKRATKN